MGSKCMGQARSPSITKTTQSPTKKLIEQSDFNIQTTSSTIFSHQTCPIQNPAISDTVTKLGVLKQFHLQQPIWKLVQYTQMREKLYGICKWKSKMSKILNGQGALYCSKINSEFLILGIFDNGKIIKSSKYLKIFGNGSHYQGFLNQDLEGEGQGQIVYSSNDRYIGQFVKGIPHGKGEMFHDEKHFTGIVNLGQKKSGKQISSHGQYEGEFDGNMRHGYGVLKLKNGIKYDGQFSKNKRDGFGTLYNKNGKVEYSGQWSKDEKKG